ncbi:MAG: type IX secretion system sortase PorU [Saprospiraceae bacterium]
MHFDENTCRTLTQRLRKLQDMKNLFTVAACLLALNSVFAKLPTSFSKTLAWEEPLSIQMAEDSEPVQLVRFEDAVYLDEFGNLPVFSERFLLDGFGNVTAAFTSAQFENMDAAFLADSPFLLNEVQPRVVVEKERSEYYARIYFVPLRKTGGGQVEKLISFSLRLNFEPQPEPLKVRNGHTTESVLMDGQLFKFAVAETGMYKLDFDFLKNQLGVPVENIDPRAIRIYGNGGGMLPEANSMERPDDLIENAIQVVGEDDGTFNSGDYILMYAEGPDKHYYDETTQTFSVPKNIYDNRNYYFLKIGSGTGLRVQDVASPQNPDHSSSEFNDFIRYEKDERNIMHDWSYGEGSGKQWFGDYFKVTESKSYDQEFLVPDLVGTAPAYLKAVFAGRIQSGQTGRFRITANGTVFTSNTFSSTGGGSIDLFASSLSVQGEFTPGSNEFSIQLDFIRPSNSFNEGWLDYIEVNFRRKLNLSGNQLRFRDLYSIGYNATEFRISGAGESTRVWNITNPQLPANQLGSLSGDVFSFVANTSELAEFIAFNDKAGFLTPEAIGAIPNQNIHGITSADLVILYHSKFLEAAQRLADHRINFSGLDVAMVDVEQLYNEFSSGRKDPTAIRDFAKMLYERAPEQFRYLLLFGDGSFDARDIYKLAGDYIPVWETANSTSPIYSYPSDDYYALLDDNEGGSISFGALDIAVGRLPVNTLEEANGVVDKIIHYDSSPVTLKDWRNRIAFVGDDEDTNLHTRDADGIADYLGEKFPNLNIDKIYLDAFEQVSTPGGTRVPLATEAINNNIFKGVAALVYLGHGGTKGWAQERVLKIEDILSWENFDKLPLIITATCSFAAYDNPAFTSAGELALIHDKGGAIALFTTVRPVFANANERLTRTSMDTLFNKLGGDLPAMGEALRLGKNKTNDNTNSRKYSLLGDPSQHMALPAHNVVMTKIDEQELSAGVQDTIRALQKVTVEGEIRDDNGTVVEDFNGVLYPTIYDKKVMYRTLSQDPGSPYFDFDLQKNIIFKGRASVVNGRFQYTFVVPKDINYAFGKSKFSYYAADESAFVDAAGNYREIYVGGTDPNALADDRGPDVEVLLNDENFVFGGITNENPTLIVKLKDDNGINVAGNSIGHDLAAILDEDSKNTHILNDFYESSLDDYTSGEVRFPLSSLAEGRHQIKVSAWDVANNPAEGYTEFVVASNAAAALDHVLNYPNPFTSSTCFMFEHNLSGAEMDVVVQIYTVSGRLIKTLQQRIISNGFRLGTDNCIPWDGRDDYGDPLAKGVYLYKVKVRTNASEAAIEGESDFEKLVILR